MMFYNSMHSLGAGDLRLLCTISLPSLQLSRSGMWLFAQSNAAITKFMPVQGQSEHSF